MLASRAKAEKAAACGEGTSGDGRTELQKLESTTPAVVQALRKLLEAPAAKLGAASPTWLGRALDKRVTPPSALDHLHDLLFETDLWSAGDTSEAHARMETSVHIGKIVLKVDANA